MKKYISPVFESEKVETIDVICASANTSFSIVEEQIVENNQVVGTKGIVEISFDSIFR